MNIVLLNPEIPYNTGNIGRTCVLTNTTLHLIKPLGFSIDEKSVRRAGLDYWKDVKIVMWENLDEFLEANKDKKIYFATTKTNQKYSDVNYGENDFIMFGPESRGIPEDVLNILSTLSFCGELSKIATSCNVNVSFPTSAFFITLSNSSSVGLLELSINPSIKSMLIKLSSSTVSCHVFFIFHLYIKFYFLVIKS